MRVFLVPRGNWTTALATAIRESQYGDYILVQSWEAVELGNSAEQRMSKFALITTEAFFMSTIRREIGFADVVPVEGEWVTCSEEVVQ